MADCHEYNVQHNLLLLTRAPCSKVAIMDFSQAWITFSTLLEPSTQIEKKVGVISNEIRCHLLAMHEITCGYFLFSHANSNLDQQTFSEPVLGNTPIIVAIQRSVRIVTNRSALLTPPYLRAQHRDVALCAL